MHTLANAKMMMTSRIVHLPPPIRKVTTISAKKKICREIQLAKRVVVLTFLNQRLMVSSASSLT